MITTLLFDLDGTLLPLDMEKFLQAYMGTVAEEFADIIEPNHMQKSLWEATKMMMKNNDGNKTNFQVFWEAFSPLVGHDIDQLEPRFLSYYQEIFPNVKYATNPNPLGRQIVELAINKGLKIVLATNPLFPKIATEERMRWANILDLPWLTVTTYEDTYYCKPNPNYFKELLTKLDLTPEECLMIGNDPLEDLAASQYNIQTYLITDNQVKRETPYSPTYSGSLENLKNFVSQL